MEADIAPVVAANGTEETSTQSVAPTMYQELHPRTEQQQNKPIEASSATVVGEIIDYLQEGDDGTAGHATVTEETGATAREEESATATEGEGAKAVAANAVAAAEPEPMGEAEFLDDEMPDVDVHKLIEEVDNANKSPAKPSIDTASENPVAGDVDAEVDTAAKAKSLGVDAEEEETDIAGDGGADGAAAEDNFETASEEEAELILGDEPIELAEGTEPVAAVRERKKEEEVDENQCRVCTTKEGLVSLFKKTVDATPADMLVDLCPNLSIAVKDFMPQFICGTCLNSLTIAIQFRKQLETTERDLRKRLSRGKNKVRRPRGYVVIDAPVSDSASDDDEDDDVEFKVSDVAGSTSAESDSADSDISEKRKRPLGRGRGRKKATKRGSEDNEEESGSAPKRKGHSSPSMSSGPFECNQCDLTFSRKQSYVLHRKSHDPRRVFTCEICEKTFKVQWAYKTHMERHALERAHFRCELCTQVFKLRAELKRHMAVRHDEHGFIYECKRCQRTFLTQQRLQRHQSTSCLRHGHEEHSSYHNKRRSTDGQPQGRDLFKSVAPLTTTYWSDSFSD
ncbi:uncharacterized zinc finger protein CG2678 [Drosophila guanche]|uniref:Blast:Zinc finger protein 319 n=2 Tax=Drosophila guanche TaxID=7266 RepID=A0A3B0JKI6_DROGU|nr:uncharacterized zinc finger protein CG2678 [Drosophila guanche]SPP73979.1 blast:Zinc finger protein 319 [Drosophila guanche]